MPFICAAISEYELLAEPKILWVRASVYISTNASCMPLTLLLSAGLLVVIIRFPNVSIRIQQNTFLSYFSTVFEVKFCITFFASEQLFWKYGFPRRRIYFLVFSSYLEFKTPKVYSPFCKLSTIILPSVLEPLRINWVFPQARPAPVR